MTPKIKLIYEGKDITQEVTKYITNLSYTDAVTGESDEIQVTLQDIDGNWRNSWRMNKGDKIKLSLGYDDSLVDCGTFEVDEIELSGPPDTVSFRGLATPVSSPLRSQNSKAFENLQLADIVQSIADKYSLTVQGEIPAITIPRATQAMETDIAFLNRIAQEYLMLFSIRNDTLTFTEITKIDKSNPVLTIDRKDCISYSITDKTVDVQKSINTGSMDAKSGQFLGSQATTTGNFAAAQVSTPAASWQAFADEIMIGKMRLPNAIGYSFAFPSDLKNLFDYIYSELEEGGLTISEGRGRPLGVIARAILSSVSNSPRFSKAAKDHISANYTEIVKQAVDNLLAKLKQKAAVENAYNDSKTERYNAQTQQIADYRATSSAATVKTRQVTGRISLIGQPAALAGNNFTLSGFDRYGGVYHIEKSTHNISRSGGYVTDIEFKLVKQS